MWGVTRERGNGERQGHFIARRTSCLVVVARLQLLVSSRDGTGKCVRREIGGGIATQQGLGPGNWCVLVSGDFTKFNPLIRAHILMWECGDH